jgi:hypothetical protein
MKRQFRVQRAPKRRAAGRSGGRRWGLRATVGMKMAAEKKIEVHGLGAEAGEEKAEEEGG